MSKRESIMKNKSLHTDENLEGKPKRRAGKVALKAAAWTAGILLGILVLLVGAVCVATWLLTPDRLARIINEEASERMNADVKTSNVTFTIWSTFPRLCIGMDSISVVSRNFKALSGDDRDKLPGNADSLLSTGAVKGGINVMSLLKGMIRLQNLEVDSLRLNLVALNDSVNNFDIVDMKIDEKDIPDINIGDIRLLKNGRLDYYAAESDTKIGVDLTGVDIRHEKVKDTYAMRILGNVSAKNGKLTLLDNFPVSLDGVVKLSLKPLRIATTDYRIALGNVWGKVTLDASLGKRMLLNDFKYSIDDFSVGELLDMLPPGLIPLPRGLDAALNLAASARLTSPCDFSASELPSLAVEFQSEDGRVGYMLTNGQRYEVDDLDFNGHLLFDGKNPDNTHLSLNNLRARGEGISLDCDGEARNFTTNPSVTANLHGAADLAKAGQLIAALRPYGLAGNVQVNAGVGFTLEEHSIAATSLNVHATGDGLKADVAPYDIAVNGMEFSTQVNHAEPLTMEGLLTDVPLLFTLTADEARMESPADTLTLHATDLKLNGKVGKSEFGLLNRRFGALFTGDRVNVMAKGMQTHLRNAQVALNANRLKKPKEAKPFVAPAVWNADARTLGFARHTPQLLQVKTPPALAGVMREWDGDVTVTLDRGYMMASGMPAPTRITDMAVRATFDSVMIAHVNVSSQSSGANLTGKVTNLRQFLTSPSPAPLNVALQVDMDTIELNEITKAIAAANPDYIANEPADHLNSDSVTLLVPRNLNVDVTLSADASQYYNLRLHDLSTRIRTRDGNADIDSLKIGLDFGELWLNFDYKTADMQRMAMLADLGVEDVNVVDFFKDFHNLLLMAPEMKNFEGVISAHGSGRALLFPDMDFNVPSVGAKMDVEGRHMTLHQNDFIRRITKMMLIRNDGDIHIPDFTARAKVRDNLLQVYPFDFEFSRYKLRLGGLNNFSGDLYYHVGVLKSPIPFPFGINVKGDYDHPALHFGGPHWKPKEGVEVTERLLSHEHINIVAALRKLAYAFVKKGAEYHPGDSF